jgi:hypothetical protein
LRCRFALHPHRPYLKNSGQLSSRERRRCEDDDPAIRAKLPRPGWKRDSRVLPVARGYPARHLRRAVTGRDDATVAGAWTTSGAVGKRRTDHAPRVREAADVRASELRAIEAAGAARRLTRRSRPTPERAHGLSRSFGRLSARPADLHQKVGRAQTSRRGLDR